jgi:hypothetical protein
MNVGQVLMNEIRKLFRPVSLQPARVRTARVQPDRDWVARTRCW